MKNKQSLRSNDLQKGLAHIIVILLLIAGILGGLVLIKYPQIFKPRASGSLSVTKVTPKSEYKNPFKKETQYVNPFETYKNPFVIAK